MDTDPCYNKSIVTFKYIYMGLYTIQDELLLPRKRSEVARRRSIHSITLKLSGAPGIETKKRTRSGNRNKRKVRARGKGGQYAEHEKGGRKAKSKRNSDPFIILIINLSMSVSIHSKLPY